MALNGDSVAIYWDFENLHASLVDQAYGPGSYLATRFKPQDELVDVAAIIEYAMSLGPIGINRAFANWVSFNRYKQALLQSAIELIQVFPPGANAKNGADIKLCLDVMDDMVRFPHVRTIIVVGGDSDYMPLSYKVKAAGRTLVGIGSRRTTNQHWARSCHEFKFYESLLAVPAASTSPDKLPAAIEQQPLNIPEPAAPPSSTEALPTPDVASLVVADLIADDTQRQQAACELITKALSRLSQAKGEAWVNKAGLRPYVQRMDPTFHESSYGYSTFNAMLASMANLIEVRRGEFDHEVRLRSTEAA